jgi:hypothetical protein
MTSGTTDRGWSCSTPTGMDRAQPNRARVRRSTFILQHRQEKYWEHELKCLSGRQWGIATTVLNMMMRYLYAFLSVRSREEPLLTKGQEDMSTSIVFGCDSKKWYLYSFRKSKTGCVGRPCLFTVQIVLFPLCHSHFCHVGGADMLSRICAHIMIGSMFLHKTAFKFHLTFLRFIFSRWWRITLP